jgi:hypothetical protein
MASTPKRMLVPSYGLVLTTFHEVPERATGLYLLPLAASNFFGPVLLAPLFDTVGRRKMIVSGTLLVEPGGLPPGLVCRRFLVDDIAR